MRVCIESLFLVRVTVRLLITLLTQKYKMVLSLPVALGHAFVRVRVEFVGWTWNVCLWWRCTRAAVDRERILT